MIDFTVFSFSKLKLLREFVKYVQSALPNYTLSLVLVLPLHLSDTYHLNSRSISNGELLHDLSLNVVTALQKDMGRRCEVLFVDSRAKNDFIVDKILEVLSTDASAKDNESSENGRGTADLGYMRATLPLIHQAFTPSTAQCY